jgi:ribose transport system ATP-binding protein
MAGTPESLKVESDVESSVQHTQLLDHVTGEDISMSSPGLATPATEEPILELRGVVKRFGGATALSGVDFALRRGAIHGLLGENGAGKSTLMKILSGVHSPDEGEIILEGTPVKFHSPAGAKALGVGMIYQELTTVPTLTVAENVFLGRQYTNRLGMIDWGRMRKDANDALRTLGINIDVNQRMGSLSLGNQQLVEIARIITSGAKIIILDEPTSALSGPESERLFGLMRQLKARGTSMIFISHFIEDVMAVSDRVTILKNSRRVATLDNVGLTKSKLIELMIGRDATELAESYEEGTQLPPRVEGQTALTLESLTVPDEFQDISFDVKHGEILGMFGYLGGGMTEVARALFGRLKPSHGTIQIDGEVIQPTTPTRAKKLGIAYLTENRRATIFPRHEVFKNITLAHLPDLVPALFTPRHEIDVADRLVKTTGVRPANARMFAGHLSGGNQQKVVLAKWLTKTPKVLILNEPTRGMDVGAKREVLDLIKALKAQGVAIILMSTEPETVMAESDRILVMSKGKITAEFVDERVTKERLLVHA